MLNKDLMLKIFDKLLLEAKNSFDEFNAADAKIGDGDLGVTILKGLEEINNNKQKFKNDLGENFMICSQSFVKKSGSSFGTLIAFSFMNISKNLKGKETCNHSEIIKIIDIALKTMQQRGKTKLGDKTIVDTLYAISIKLKEAKEEVNYVQIFKLATKQALNNFKGKKILVGRARMFEDKTKGLDDPGMLAFNKLAEAF